MFHKYSYFILGTNVFDSNAIYKNLKMIALLSLTYFVPRKKYICEVEKLI